MYATDFIYDGQSLSDLGFIICEFDGSSSVDVYEAGVPIAFKTVARRKGRRYSLVDLKYENALEISFDICRDPCVSGEDNMEIDDMDYLAICRWLLRNEYHDLMFINEKHSIPRYYRGIFNISKLMVDDLLIGLRLVVTTDKPYAYGDPIIFNKTFAANDTWNFQDNSVLVGNVTPSLTITCVDNGALTLSNDLTDTQMQIKNCSSGEVITVDGENFIISSSIASHDIWDDFNYEFLTIGNTKNNTRNNISSSLACEVILQYSPVIKDTP